VGLREKRENEAHCARAGTVGHGTKGLSCGVLSPDLAGFCLNIPANEINFTNIQIDRADDAIIMYL